MTRLSLSCAATALCLSFAIPAHARDVDRFSVPSPAFPGHALTDEGVQLAQVSDPRVTQLEEQVRQLNGLVEELNFQILQMQEQMRKLQEDNEFRLQQLEQRSGVESPTDAQTTSSATLPSDTQAAGTDNRIAATQDLDPPLSSGGSTAERGVPPRTFGTITFDDKGNATGAGLPEPSAADQQVAALPQAGSAEESYRNAYQFILSGDYKTAEIGFREHLERYPEDERTADANFWLGEALLGQNRPRDAAEVFLSASRDYPRSPKAPDMLLKLGVSLAAMNQKEIACATFQEIGQRYPNASGQIKERVTRERQDTGC